MTFKVGIIGLGMIGASMLQEFINHPKFTIGGVWDRNEKINADIASRFPHVPIAQDAASLIDDPEIDLVYVATPPVTHVAYGLQVIAAGKALLCDKPLAIDLEQGRRLVETAVKHKTPTAMNFVYGAGPLVETIEQQLASGALGTPQSIEVRYQFPSWPLPNQLSAASWINKRNAGGMVREMFSHFVYLIHRLFGEITVKSTVLHYPEGENAAEDFVLASLETGNIPIWLMGGIGGPAAPRESELTIHGTKASLRLGNLYSLAITHNGAWQPLAIDPAAPSPAQARLNQLAQLLAHKPTTLPDLQAGLRVQELIETMLS
ncbi:MAG: Gfo/Idh/MocA family oxidoreductase [Anaerolineales bacterium]|nr:Gfo/Idh/MocA family oxidoreductase [Anaerolineales bacterium]MCB8937304.1 Gfo/Idh/MocA family oxidoreductase [Ardenticatenaceae bacterium]